MHEVLLRLAAGDMRTTGASNEVAEEIATNLELFDIVVMGLDSGNPGLRLRCADAIEKASKQRSALLDPHKSHLLRILNQTQQIEVQWHLALLVPRLSLTEGELESTILILQRYFEESKSRITRVCALEAIVELSAKHPHLAELAELMLQQALGSSIPSVKARAKKLLIARHKSEKIRFPLSRET